jgi:hypothetical protein
MKMPALLFVLKIKSYFLFFNFLFGNKIIKKLEVFNEVKDFI